eukprot:2903104-Alexandrium_andersonii.AAC.1
MAVATERNRKVGKGSGDQTPASAGPPAAVVPPGGRYAPRVVPPGRPSATSALGLGPGAGGGTSSSGGPAMRGSVDGAVQLLIKEGSEDSC